MIKLLPEKLAKVAYNDVQYFSTSSVYGAYSPCEADVHTILYDKAIFTDLTSELRDFIICHEFGHLFLDINDFYYESIEENEKAADSFSEKILGYGNPLSVNEKKAEKNNSNKIHYESLFSVAI